LPPEAWFQGIGQIEHLTYAALIALQTRQVGLDVAHQPWPYGLGGHHHDVSAISFARLSFLHL
jgi:hypothetical protein